MKIVYLLFFILITGCMTGSIVYEPEGPYKVTKVLDGDTLDVNNGERIRLIGINTPEKNECYYKEATEELKKLTEGKVILLEIDNADKDKYGRLLRVVYVKGINVNSHMIEKGFARVFDEFPSLDYNSLKQLEKIAKEKNLGLWNC